MNMQCLINAIFFCYCSKVTIIKKKSSKKTSCHKHYHSRQIRPLHTKKKLSRIRRLLSRCQKSCKTSLYFCILSKPLQCCNSICFCTPHRFKSHVDLNYSNEMRSAKCYIYMLFQVEKIGYNFFVCTKVSIPKNTLQYQIRLAFPIVRLFAKKSRNFLKILSESLGLNK